MAQVYAYFPKNRCIIQSDSRIASDLAPLFLQHELLSHRILRCFSI
jgi:hypothetical protein